MDDVREQVPDRGMLSASDNAWEHATKMAKMNRLLTDLPIVGHGRADAAASDLGISRRQVYVLAAEVATLRWGSFQT
ncbi:hypothetical protein LWF01_18900 [Saxibacter everestensis]|uniref:DNA binding HTH domain-containing protein n=1 Tax=Saxibacter everestensis TaxID=2909229 RepID=A0ABY8QUL9_9MICO|nr:hypothetical protein LWF01_18900 [Brevibacteriaceae bacterium ZFBP1038]